jgi:hypothetical protein
VQDRYETGAKAECRTKVEGLHYPLWAHLLETHDDCTA